MIILVGITNNSGRTNLNNDNITRAGSPMTRRRVQSTLAPTMSRTSTRASWKSNRSSVNSLEDPRQRQNVQYRRIPDVARMRTLHGMTLRVTAH